MNTYALHGFLGRPEDFNVLKKPCTKVRLDPVSPFDVWAKAFNRTITTKNNCLIGYSMGGRLALHALMDAPHLWQKAILLSTHPGLESHERPARIAHDRSWSERFLNDPWDEVMTAWNNQDVFLNEPRVREEKHYDRKILSQMLLTWSLGNQDDLTHAIARLPMPIFWGVGERDVKFCSLARRLKFQHPQSQVWVAAGVGHRRCLC